MGLHAMGRLRTSFLNAEPSFIVVVCFVQKNNNCNKNISADNLHVTLVGSAINGSIIDVSNDEGCSIQCNWFNKGIAIITKNEIFFPHENRVTQQGTTSREEGKVREMVVGLVSSKS